MSVIATMQLPHFAHRPLREAIELLAEQLAHKLANVIGVIAAPPGAA